MPDIRSFFGPKGGGPPAAPKPAAKKVEDDPPKRRGKARKVIDDDSDDEVIETKPKKPATRSSPRKKAAEKADEGTVTTASEYFSKTKVKPATTSDSKSKAAPKTEARSSPRTTKKSEAPVKAEPAAAKNGSAATSKRSAASNKKYDFDDDDDAFMDDAEDGDDILAADSKGRNKRKNDDYVEEESEDEVLPKPKRIASRGKKPIVVEDDDDEDDEPVVSKPTKAKTTAASKKRKSPEAESEEEDEDDEPVAKKKPAAKKPRAPPKSKKADEPEDAAIQAIFDDIPTVRPPTPPAKDPNAPKFDWRKAQPGGGNAGPAPNPIAELPEGEEDCLSGLTFVFTGQLQQIAREEAQALVKRYGGKITGAPSSKTNYVVLGEDAGPSKLAKIAAHNIKTIDENGLFELIRRLPAGGGTGKGAEKLREKRKAEEEKIKQQALEMEKEEKARKVEAEKARKLAAARGAPGPAPAATQPAAQLWTVKYAPTQASHICGNKAAVEKIQSWLRNWVKSRRYDFQKRGADGMGGYRAIILSGPPGIGKTTAAHLAAKLEGYDVLEQNASDTRSKKMVENGLGEVMNNTSLNGYFAGDGKNVDLSKKKMVLIMDEVDGMSGGDRGGVGALAKFAKKTEVPLILICNERRLPKMKPFDFVAFDVKFQRPTIDQIRSRMMTVCHREGLKLSPQVLEALIEGSNRDIRQTINMLSTVKLDQTSMDYDQSKSMSKAWEKSIVLKPWDICQKMLGGGLFSAASKATLNDKIELYFNDHEFSYLMIQENYLRTKPAALNAQGYNKREQSLKALELASQAADSISDGDLVDRMIHGPQQQWSLMPTHAVFSTVRPSSFVAGQLMGSNFTSWLGNNSKYGKLGRYVREIHSHMRLRSSGDANEVRQQYLPLLWSQTVKKLASEGKDSVDDVIDLMDSYFLTREDFDSIKELGVGYMDEELVSIETQTKSTFTRLYNQKAHPIPFMKASNVGAAPKKATKDVPDLEEAIEEEDEGDALEAADVVEDDEDDIKGDKYIKQPKAKAKKPAKKAKAADDDDGDEEKPKAKGRAKAPAKGKAKK
ncbi:replication factor RFC1 C terminal domain-containing protein [Pestalotiopsis sp. NC0098]|nr:replication factor RFC1 C terminal domain-containing protein [Pestalotiopsis sp. NC0098]